MRVLCLDVGSKTIGVALSDPFGWTAQGVTTLARREVLSDARSIQALVGEYEVEKIIVGLPLQMNGTEGKQAAAVREFVEKIRDQVGVPILLWDERLSTAAAERGLLEADLSRAKRKRVIDKMAAVFILQGYLDSHRDFA